MIISDMWNAHPAHLLRRHSGPKLPTTMAGIRLCNRCLLHLPFLDFSSMTASVPAFAGRTSSEWDSSVPQHRHLKIHLAKVAIMAKFTLTFTRNLNSVRLRRRLDTAIMTLGCWSYARLPVIYDVRCPCVRTNVISRQTKRCVKTVTLVAVSSMPFCY